MFLVSHCFKFFIKYFYCVRYFDQNCENLSGIRSYHKVGMLKEVFE